MAAAGNAAVAQPCRSCSIQMLRQCALTPNKLPRGIQHPSAPSLPSTDAWSYNFSSESLWGSLRAACAAAAGHAASTSSSSDPPCIALMCRSAVPCMCSRPAPSGSEPLYKGLVRAAALCAISPSAAATAGVPLKCLHGACCPTCPGLSIALPPALMHAERPSPTAVS